jgi:hypothetical protein
MFAPAPPDHTVKFELLLGDGSHCGVVHSGGGGELVGARWDAVQTRLAWLAEDCGGGREPTECAALDRLMSRMHAMLRGRCGGLCASDCGGTTALVLRSLDLMSRSITDVVVRASSLVQ